MGTYTITTYLKTKKTIREKIIACDALIELLEDRMLESATDSSAVIDEYSMDDGQVKIRTSYRSIQDIENAIVAITRKKERLKNSLHGRVVVLRDVRGLR